jgi:HlyD family secretion protein
VSRRTARVAAGAALVMLVAVAVAWYALRAGSPELAGVLASGSVEATEADLGFQLGGRIRTIAVREGEPVVAGQLLAELDAAELQARRAGAEAQADAARAALAELEVGARPEERRQAQAVEAAARERLGEAERLWQRAVALEQGGAVSREALDHARTALEVARAQHAQAREQMDVVQRGARVERLDAQRAVVRQAEAALAQADAALEHARIVAPFAGTVTVRHRQPGEAVGAGAPVLTVMDPADRWVRIYVREDVVGRVAVGQAATIRTDSERDRSYAGRVTYIAQQAEFTPRNVQTAEERVKLVYAVKVSIADDARFALKPGMPADVTLRIDR